MCVCTARTTQEWLMPCLHNSTWLLKLSHRCAVHTARLHRLVERVVVCGGSVLITWFFVSRYGWLLYVVFKQPFVSKSNARSDRGNVRTQCTGWCFSITNMETMQMSPSAHFLCHNVVEKKKEENVRVEEYMGMPLCSKTSRQTAGWAKTV